MTKDITCRICGSDQLFLKKESSIKKDLDSRNFAITNSDYGQTGELHQCSSCGFLQCVDLTDVLKFYEELEDPEYESGREERKLQEQKVVELARRIKHGGRLLDIGAGSGMLVESAIEKGYDAEGVEPSKWLQKKAEEHGLPVRLGIFPQENILKGPYDVVTLIDVIEHVPNPLELLKEVVKVMKDDGIFIMVTPDLDSFMAKMLGWKWWHFRFAHIGYFNSKTLKMLTGKAGLECIKMKRPSWYFTCGYLINRLYFYLPGFLHFPVASFIKNIVIPVNLRDSMLGVYKKNKEK